MNRRKFLTVAGAAAAGAVIAKAMPDSDAPPEAGARGEEGVEANIVITKGGVMQPCIIPEGVGVEVDDGAFMTGCVFDGPLVAMQPLVAPLRPSKEMVEDADVFGPPIYLDGERFDTIVAGDRVDYDPWGGRTLGEAVADAQAKMKEFDRELRKAIPTDWLDADGEPWLIPDDVLAALDKGRA